jgi:hypothetical protein
MDRGNDTYRERARAALAAALAHLRRSEGELRFRALLIAIPASYQLIGERRLAQARYYGMEASAIDARRPNELLAREAAAAGVRLVDATACLAASSSPDKLYYRQDNHFTAAGHAAFADCVADPIAAFLAGKS